jgi:hypothetical protein
MTEAMVAVSSALLAFEGLEATVLAGSSAVRRLVDLRALSFDTMSFGGTGPIALAVLRGDLEELLGDLDA